MRTLPRGRGPLPLHSLTRMLARGAPAPLARLALRSAGHRLRVVNEETGSGAIRGPFRFTALRFQATMRSMDEALWTLIGVADGWTGALHVKGGMIPVLMVSPWRDAGDRSQWSVLRVECPWIPQHEWTRLVMARRGPFVFRTRASMAAPKKGLMPSATAVEAIEIIPGTAAEAGFPETPPPPVSIPDVLREAVFTTGYESVEGLIAIDGVEVEVLLDLAGSKAASPLQRKIARYVERLEHITSRWPALRAEVLERARDIPPEGDSPSRWVLQSVELASRRTTLWFEDEANDAEHGLQAHLDGSGALRSIETG